MKMVGTSGTLPTTLLDTARYSVAGDNQSRIVLMVPVGLKRAWRWTVSISGSSCETAVAYLFSTSTGQEISQLTAFDGSEADRFGWSVSIDPDHIVVGVLH
jgi:hypothetical protein